MNLQQRCFYASAAVHGLVVLILVAGASFVVSHPPIRNSSAAITFYRGPFRLTDSDSHGGGKPSGTVAPVRPPPAPVKPVVIPQDAAPVARPAPPQVTPHHQRHSRPKPPEPKPPRPPEPDRKPVVEPLSAAIPAAKKVTPETDTKPKTATPKRKIEVNLTEVVKHPKARVVEEDQAALAAASVAARRQQIQAQRELVANEVAKEIRDRLSHNDVTSEPQGEGGEAYVNYGEFVVGIFDRAWNPPAGIPDDSTVVARVVIGKDGKVLEARIETKSGLDALDKSVQAALDRVVTIGQPFPTGAKDERRTFLINFNLKAKRALG